MMEESTPSPEQSQEPRQPGAAEHVAEAHRILNGLRQRLDKHPELEEAIAKLEMALSILTTKTAGML
jgi:hypothetical protein